MIITPYFVAGKGGVKTIGDMLDRGVRVIVVTNSLASTNHVAVHSGYARYRKQLLEMGAELYEIKADAVSGDAGGVVAAESLTLHSKVTIIDRATILVGSLNFDPRSIEINTEMGLFIESSDAGAALFDIVADGLTQVTYRVNVDDNGKLQWQFAGDEGAPILDVEPLTSWTRRSMARFYGILPIEKQL